MRIVSLSVTSVLVLSMIFVTGCADPCANLRGLNATQREKITSLEGRLGSAQLELNQCVEQLNAARGRGDIAAGSLQQQVAALEGALRDKNSLIENLQRQLLKGGTALPPELTASLRDWALTNEAAVSFDEASGVVQFRNDVLFAAGSAAVSSNAVEAIRSLAGIMNSEAARDFDILVAGHTDDQPIVRSQWKNNWELSAQRGLSVLEILTAGGVTSERLSVRAFGEYRPLVPNAPGKRGNQANRRVEIFIIGRGA
ncbi:MAG TPA: OmpA family protein [Sedimentisphaerales bacterium]|nr:OmpA family protein [Sedimentisphaerales bacterium]